MQAVMISGGLARADAAGARFSARIDRPALRLQAAPWDRLLPVLTALSRAAMGCGVGMIFASLAGNATFWIGLGVVLGVGLDAAASRAGSDPAVEAAADGQGPYRVR
jgi:hypothetical protein